MTEGEDLLRRYHEESARLVGRLRLSDVRMVSSAVSLSDDLGLSPSRIDNLQAQYGFTIDLQESKVVYFLGFSGAVLAADGESVASFEIKYGGLYEGVPDVGDANGLASFGVLVASMTLWAYIRAQLSNQLALMGLGTAFQLPVVTAGQLVEAGIRPPLVGSSDPAG